jgi:hypothetical protein
MKKTTVEETYEHEPFKRLKAEEVQCDERVLSDRDVGLAGSPQQTTP